MKRALCSAVLVLVACGSKPPPPPPAPEVPSAPDASDVSASDAATATATPSPTPTATPTSTPTPTPTSTPSPTDDSNDAAGVAYLESVQLLYKQQRDPLTTACWLHAKSTERAYAGKAVIRVGPGGKVVSTKTDGTDDATSTCIDKQIKKWKLPPPNGTATVTLPIRLHRD